MRRLVVVIFVLLAIGSALLFREIDASSHSASDTIRPFVLSMGPQWIAAVLAARIVLRGGRA